MSLLILSSVGIYENAEALYQWGEFPSSKQKFVSAALKHWFPEAEVKILLTKQAKEKNGPIIKESIPDYQPIDIENVETEEDNWKLFQVISEAVPENSEVIFDITQGFRSMPLVTLLALSYLRIVKNVNLRHVVYGAWDKNRLDDETTPLFDLTPFVSLLDWANAAKRFQDTGDAGLFKGLIRENYAANLNNVAEHLEKISKSLANNRTIESGHLATRLLELIKDSEEQELLRKHTPFMFVIDQIKQEMAPLQHQEDLKLSLMAHYAQIQWYFQRGHYVQAIGLAREWLISVLSWNKHNEIQLDRQERRNLEKYLNGFVQSPQQADPKLQNMIVTWDKITTLRNDLLHFGMRPTDDRTQSKSIKNSVKKSIESLPQAVKPLGLDLEPASNKED